MTQAMRPASPSSCPRSNAEWGDRERKRTPSPRFSSATPAARIAAITPVVLELRRQGVRDLGDLLREYQEPLGELVSLEMGKIKAEGHGEAEDGGSRGRRAARDIEVHGHDFLHGAKH